MKSLFSQLALFFPQFWVFEAIFEARGENFLIFENSICAFYCTQNDRLDPTVSMQKSVWKTDHRGPRNLQNHFSTWHAKPNRNLIFVFCQISRPRVVHFSNRFLHWNRGIETVVLSTIKGTNGVFKNPKIFPRASKIASKTQNCGKTWPDWEKWLFI